MPSCLFRFGMQHGIRPAHEGNSAANKQVNLQEKSKLCQFTITSSAGIKKAQEGQLNPRKQEGTMEKVITMDMFVKEQNLEKTIPAYMPCIKSFLSLCDPVTSKGH